VVWPQNHSDGFRWFGLKTGGASFWRFGLKTYCYGFWRFGLKTCYDGFLWFSLKTSGDGFLQFGLKTGGDSVSRLASKSAVCFLVEPQNQGGGGIPGLGLKTGSYGLVICALKSLRRFLGLSLKTKQVLVYRLCHETDRGRSMWDTR
jgi:hypothetical protein